MSVVSAVGGLGNQVRVRSRLQLHSKSEACRPEVYETRSLKKKKIKLGDGGTHL